MREESRGKGTPCEEGGCKDNADRNSPLFGKMRAVATTWYSFCRTYRILVCGLNYDDSQTTWLGDAVCTNNRDREGPLPSVCFGYVHALERRGSISLVLQLVEGLR